MTAAKRNVGRYWLWFVGSAPPSRPLAKPIEKPPSVAGIGRFEAAEHDACEHDDGVAEREVRRDERVLHGEHHGDDGRERARDEHGAADDAVRADAEQARSAEVHRRRAHLQADRRARQQQLEQQQADDRDDDRDDGDLADVDARDRHRAVERRERRGDLPERAEREQRDALQQECDRERRDEHHRGRLRAQRPEHEQVHRDREREHDAEAEENPDPARQIPLRGEGERVGAGHDQLPVREVDEAQHAEDEADPDRHQRVDAAERERVGERLPVDVEDGERHARYAATSLSVSPASSGAEREPQLAVRDHVRAVGERDRALRALLDEQHREAALADRGERVEDDVDDARREPERRLVEEQDVGLRDERARDRELLLLAARERARAPPAELVDDREQLVDALERVAVAAAARRRARGGGSPRPSARRRCGALRERAPRRRARCPRCGGRRASGRRASRRRRRRARRP